MVLVQDPKDTDTISSLPPSYDATMHETSEHGKKLLCEYWQSTKTFVEPERMTEHKLETKSVTEPTIRAPSYDSLPTKPIFIHHSSELFAFSLPADHDCVQRGHVPKNLYGSKGVLAAILLFPFGFWTLMADKEVICQRCNMVLKQRTKCSYHRGQIGNKTDAYRGGCGVKRKGGCCSKRNAARRARCC
jgi:hypothetical protein